MTRVRRCVLQTDPDDRESVWAYFPEKGESTHWSSIELAVAALSELRRPRVQVVGRRDNAELICSIAQARIPEASCLVACPTGFVDPEAFCREGKFGRWGALVSSVQRMNSKALRTPLTGGWHLVGKADLRHYALEAELGHSVQDPEALLRALDRHPAAPVLRFLGHFPLQAACRLLSSVLDIRWFRDPDRPGRLSRLRMFCGLHARDHESYWSRVLLMDRGSLNERMARAKDLVACWSISQLGQPDVDDLASLTGEPQPCRFFLDLYGRDQDLGVAMRNACRRFLNLLALCWTDGLYVVDGRKPPPFCLPELIFDDDEQAVERWNNSISRS